MMAQFFHDEVRHMLFHLKRQVFIDCLAQPFRAIRCGTMFHPGPQGPPFSACFPNLGRKGCGFFRQCGPIYILGRVPSHIARLQAQLPDIIILQFTDDRIGVRILNSFFQH